MGQLFTILLLLLSQSALAFELGFPGVDQTRLPIAIQTKINTILKVQFPYFAPVDSASYTTLLNNPNTTTQNKSLLQSCLQTKLSVCYLNFGFINGTAFVDSLANKFWTNCHLVKPYLDFLKQDLILTNQMSIQAYVNAAYTKNIPVKVFGWQNKGLVEKSIPQANIDTIFLKHLNSFEDVTCSGQDDVVKISTSVPLAATGNVLTEQLFAAKQYLYLLGFPKLTQSRLLNSDGQSLRFTAGEFLPSNDYKGYFQNFPYDLATSGPFTNVVLADSAQGMSGGPVFNANGEIVGLFKGYIPLKDSDIPMASLFFNLGELKFVEIYSNQIKAQYGVF